MVDQDAAEIRHGQADANAVNLSEFLSALRENWRALVLCSFLFSLMGILVSLVIPPIYTARTTLLPPQQQQNSAALLSSSLGALAATAGLSSALKAPEELYVGLLRTESVANRLISTFRLQERYGERTLIDTRKELSRNVRIAVDRRSTLIVVEVDDADATSAAALANGYANALQDLLGRIAITDAQQRRLFFEKQVNKAKSELVTVEHEVKMAQESGGLISLDAQTQTKIEAAAQLRAQIISREVRLQSIKPYVGPENVELLRLSSEISSMRSRLWSLEQGSASSVNRSGASTNSLKNLNLYRELKFKESVYAALLQQFELATADEARDAPLVQQVDTAIPPDKESRPRRLLLALSIAFVGVVASLGYVGFINIKRNARKKKLVELERGPTDSRG